MKQTLNITKAIFITLLFLGITSCNNEKKTKTTTKNEKKMTSENKKHTVLINPFEVPAGKLEASIKYWEACRDFLKTQPGYISTKLHQSIKDDAKFELINVAVWESPKAFMEATKKMMQQPNIVPVDGLKPTPSLYTVIRE
ncbi:antibiotic biosynthesis monooxygenase family protein [uncultured Kordia sp.]|uniref:antibiotic biosynthesis monooxygenase family protein n=1 Tax=uncultured Kordia sp. TaxID=507699 RepID=UPI00260F936F|nr:antibiotic biosynthesis monooxygenase family protein [uncultured Kordia sp.]